MIQIYRPGNETFTVNGDMTLMPYRAELEASLGEVWTYTLEHPIDGAGRWKSIVEGATIKAPSFNGEQLFTIVHTEKNEQSITAEAVPVGMNAKDEVFITDKRPTNKNGQEALDILTEGTRYTGKSNITKTATAYYEYANLIEALNGGSNSFCARWGGELIFNNFEFIINERAGGDYGVEVRYGFNIPVNGFSEDIDTRNVITRIYPKAYNGHKMSNDGYVDSPIINSYPNVHAVTMKFDNVRMAEDAGEDEDVIVCNNQAELDAALTEQCELQYAAGVEKPLISIKADMVMLNGIVGYEDYGNLVTVGLGDTIHCKHSVLGIVTDARVMGLTYDSLLEKTTSVVLGSYEYNYFSKVTAMVKRVADAIRADGSLVAEQIQGFIDGAYAQLRLQNTIAKKQDVRAILFEDLDPGSPTYGALAIGTQGWQISQERTADGRDWEWTTAATSKGIIANTVVTGLLSDKLARNYWNLDTGDFKLSGATIENSTVDGYITDNDLNTFKAIIDKALSDLQDQIDGIVDTWYYPGEPSLTKPPVTYDGSDPDTGWTTDDDKRAHVGDIYYDTDTDYAYRFQYENSVFSWKRISDSDVTEALRLAQQAQDTADHKRRVFVTTPYVPYDVGDIWMQGANGDILVCTTAKTATQSYSASDFSKRNKYIDTATVNNSINTYDGTWTQSKTFNRLTNNGVLQGIYMENGQLYVNGTYIKSGVVDADLVRAGILRDTAGVNYWNLETGDFSLTSGTIGDNVTLQPLENIEFGGTNLLSRGLTVNNPTAYNFYRIPLFEKLEAEQEYTLQFWGVQLDSGSTGIGVYWGGGSNKLISTNLTPDDAGYIKVTFTVTTAQASHSQAANLWLNLYNYVNGHAGSEATIERWKLEKGNRATDWSVAPQDVSSEIAVVQSSANAAQSSANAAQSTADSNTLKLKAMYGTCSTGAGTAAKVVNATDFTLYGGATISVYFTNTNTVANPTLNVNNTGARPIYAYGTTLASPYYWSAKSLVHFTYDGSNSRWVMQVDDQKATFNHLTNGGTAQGIYMTGGQLYVNANYIKTGTMDADLVRAGTLADTKGLNYWNLETGEFSLTSGTISGATIDGYATDSELSAVNTKAVNAGTAASNAQSTANSATTKANNAQTTANTAVSNASAAQSTADTAVTNAAAAQSTADSAVSKANTAQTTANTAVTNAATAQTTANTAVSNANKALLRQTAMYGTCSTTAGTATKTVTLDPSAGDFELYKGATICVYFTYTNSASSPQLKVGNTAAKPIYAYGSTITNVSNYWWQAKDLVQFTYNGSQWVMQIDNQTATFNRLTQGGTKQGITMDANGDLYINATYIKSGTLSGITINGNTVRVGGASGTSGGGGKLYVYNSSGTQIGKWDSSGISVTSGSISGTTISGGTISGTTISGTTINGGTVTGTTVSGGSISGTTINGGTITGSVITSTLTYNDPENHDATTTDTATFNNGRLVVSHTADTLPTTTKRTLSTQRGALRITGASTSYQLDLTETQLKMRHGSNYMYIDPASAVFQANNTLYGKNGTISYSGCDWSHSSTGTISVSTGGIITPIEYKNVTVTYSSGSSRTGTWYTITHKANNVVEAWITAYLGSATSTANKSVTLPLPFTLKGSPYVVGTLLASGLTKIANPLRITGRATDQIVASFDLASANTSSYQATFHILGTRA